MKDTEVYLTQDDLTQGDLTQVDLAKVAETLDARKNVYEDFPLNDDQSEHSVNTHTNSGLSGSYNDKYVYVDVENCASGFTGVPPELRKPPNCKVHRHLLVSHS